MKMKPGTVPMGEKLQPFSTKKAINPRRDVEDLQAGKVSAQRKMFKKKKKPS